MAQSNNHSRLEWRLCEKHTREFLECRPFFFKKIDRLRVFSKFYFILFFSKKKIDQVEFFVLLRHLSTADEATLSVGFEGELFVLDVGSATNLGVAKDNPVNKIIAWHRVVVLIAAGSGSSLNDRPFAVHFFFQKKIDRVRVFSKFYFILFYFFFKKK